MKNHIAWQRERHEQGLAEQPSMEVDSLGYDSVNEIFKGEEEGSSIAVRTRLRGAASKAASKPLPAETSGSGGSSEIRESSGSESKEKQRALRRVRYADVDRIWYDRA